MKNQDNQSSTFANQSPLLDLKELMDNKTQSVLHDDNNPVVFCKNIKVDGHTDIDSATINKCICTNGYFQNLSFNNLKNHYKYLEGGNGDSGVSFNLLNNDPVTIIYCNPSKGDIYINLGCHNSPPVNENKTLFIKDVSVASSSFSTFNIYIRSIGAKLERYGKYSEAQYGLVCDDGSYIINTNGGAVTFRYMPSLIKNGPSVWIIENQFIGNPRLSSPTFKSHYPTSHISK